MSILLIRKEWLDKILSGEKTIEIRGQNCKSKIGHTIGLSYCGLKNKEHFIVATVFIEAVKKYHTIDEYNNDYEKHQSKQTALPYKNTYGWILKNIQILDKKVEYTYKKGAIICVSL